MIYKDSQIKQLRALYYTAKFSSVTLAANYLNLTQPTVSLQISSLEKQCGSQLFLREHNKMKLTNLGFDLVNKAEELLNSIDHIFKDIKQPQTIKRRINIAANNGSLNYVLPNIVGNFCQKNPDTTLKIHYAAKQQGLKMLNNSEADIFFTPKNMSLDDNYVYTEFAKYPVVLITHPSHPLASKREVSLHDIANSELVMPPQELAVIDDFYKILQRDNKTKPRCRIEFSNWEITKKFVGQNLFIAIVASLVIEKHDEFHIHDLSEFFAPISYGYVVLKDKVDKPEIREFISSLHINS